MKNILIVFSFILITLSCGKNQKEKVNDITTEIAYNSFGELIVADDAINAEAITANYAKMKSGDTLNLKAVAKVNEVCQAKGCWMKLDLPNGEEAMIKFKNYGFFVPKDIAGKDVVINGKAYVTEVSVEEQRHYAEDAGKSEEEIAKITEPKRTYSFLADGVLVPKS